MTDSRGRESAPRLAPLVHRRFSDDVCECVCVDNHPESTPICHHGAVPLASTVAWPICVPCDIACRTAIQEGRRRA